MATQKRAAAVPSGAWSYWILVAATFALLLYLGWLA
jgi:hypothetical protein